MFIQVFQGKVGDEASARRTLERWRDEVMPGATGFLGSTTGVAADGTLVGMARFESRDAAMANSGRSEQDAWWAEMAKCFDGDVAFMECDDAQEILGGGSDDAHFVQVMEGSSPDITRMHRIMGSHSDRLRQARPEILGGVMMDVGDGRYVQAFYFTSEEAARQGEQLDFPEDIRAEIEEGMALMGEATYYDLREPLMLSPA
jgi:hypothetical protein